MGYASKLYETALDTLSSRRRSAEASAERRAEEIDRRIPEIEEIKRQLASTSIELTKLVLAKTDNLMHTIEQLKNNNLHMQEMIVKLLQKNGYAADYLEAQYACRLCRDRGFVNGRRCECLNKLLTSLAAEQLNEVSPLSLCSFEGFDCAYYPDATDANLGVNPRLKMREILTYCKEYARCFSLHSSSLFMLGKTGLGKTHLSLAIANEVIAKGYNVVYGSAQDLLRSIEREHFGRERDGGNDSLNLLLCADLLIVDDLGSEYESSFNLATIYNLVNTRLNKHLPTIINSNLTTAELQKRYSDRIVSRLLAMYDYLRFVGNDIRQIKKFSEAK